MIPFISTKQPAQPMPPQFLHRLLGALNCILESIERFRFDEIAFFFNGGKDCTAVLYLLHAVFEWYQSKHPETNESDRICLQNMPVFFLEDTNSFSEIDRFIGEVQDHFNFHVTVIRSPSMKLALKNLVETSTPCIKAVYMGVRKGDPKSETLDFFTRTDVSRGWADLIRVNPVLYWDYADLWYFLREFDLPYCVLYDQGFTSLGGRTDTQPNPALYDPETQSYKPAYRLTDASQERCGRAPPLPPTPNTASTAPQTPFVSFYTPAAPQPSPLPSPSVFGNDSALPLFASAELHLPPPPPPPPPSALTAALLLPVAAADGPSGNRSHSHSALAPPVDHAAGRPPSPPRPASPSRLAALPPPPPRVGSSGQLTGGAGLVRVPSSSSGHFPRRVPSGSIPIHDAFAPGSLPLGVPLGRSPGTSGESLAPTPGPTAQPPAPPSFGTSPHRMATGSPLLVGGGAEEAAMRRRNSLEQPPADTGEAALPFPVVVAPPPRRLSRSLLVCKPTTADDEGAIALACAAPNKS
ncbi:putative flavin adenine dinucleotide synthetase [Paratrimastix pyriformis]|uniref:FAD synthase n=1 Tax=Paratrimastix pyriformis TaxID=342808 RepID=A0ABQ8UMX2_9EUKA|nr:putative flavin adenine dinucleotide synthetase [Paratrimastix pyriformis]